uniref:Uncharacterized protein n=1 Tax=Zea mays TaxID=4577 RepID=C4IZM9_MAIZE|nr:unknown [Zea mays]
MKIPCVSPGRRCSSGWSTHGAASTEATGGVWSTEATGGVWSTRGAALGRRCSG